MARLIWQERQEGEGPIQVQCTAVLPGYGHTYYLNHEDGKGYSLNFVGSSFEDSGCILPPTSILTEGQVKSVAQMHHNSWLADKEKGLRAQILNFLEAALPFPEGEDLAQWKGKSLPSLKDMGKYYSSSSLSMAFLGGNSFDDGDRAALAEGGRSTISVPGTFLRVFACFGREGDEVGLVLGQANAWRWVWGMEPTGIHMLPEGAKVSDMVGYLTSIFQQPATPAHPVEEKG